MTSPFLAKPPRTPREIRLAMLRLWLAKRAAQAEESGP